MEEVARVGIRTVVAVHRFDREGEERLVMAYRSLENERLAKATPEMDDSPDGFSEHEQSARRPFCLSGQEVS